MLYNPSIRHVDTLKLGTLILSCANESIRKGSDHLWLQIITYGAKNDVTATSHSLCIIDDQMRVHVKFSV